MALTPDQRKKLLGFGGLKRIADERGVTEGHVSQVNSEKRTDSQPIRDAISARILELHPDIDPTTIWPAANGGAAQQLPQDGGNDPSDVREHARTLATRGLGDVPADSVPAGTGANRRRAVR